MSLTVKKYQITAVDTIQDIAQYQLNDRSKWVDLVALNNLRSPYISYNPLDQFAPFLGALSLQSGLAKGSNEIGFWDVTNQEISITLLARGNIIAFTSLDTEGAKIYDIALIQSVTKTIAAGSAHLILQVNLINVGSFHSLTKTLKLSKIQGMQRDHNPGESFQVFGNPFLLTTAVAEVGDALSLPILRANQTSSVIDITSQDIIDHLGVDMALDNTGQKILGANGDLGLVSGTSNLKQALKNRINTNPGELGLHPSYGCAIQLYLGTPQDAGWGALVKSLVSDCVSQDSRVSAITRITFIQKGDASFVDMDVQVSVSGQLVTGIVPLNI